MKIKVLGIITTTHCNLACENCSNAIPNLAEHKHMSWEDITEIADLSRDIPLPGLTISGGEPLLSPIFPKLSKNLRELFVAGLYMLRTNGLLIRENLESLKAFDQVVASFYPGRSPKWMERLPDLDKRIRLYLNTRFWDMSRAHPSKQKGEPWKYCYAYRRVNIALGRVYPCCNMFGMMTHRKLDLDNCSVPVGPDWLERVLAIDMAPLCKECPWPR